jgi:hypothetical protein
MKQLFASVFSVVLGVVLFFLIGGLFSSTAPVSTPGNPPVVMVVLDPSLEQYSNVWANEIGRRFPNAVGVLVHGGDFVEDEWIVGTSWRPDRHVTRTVDVVRHYQELYPSRTMVLLACNPGHLKLGIPGVYYAMSSVWCVPDRAVDMTVFSTSLQRTLEDGEFDHTFWNPPDIFPKLESRSSKFPDVVGNIFEFVHE